MAKTEQDQCCTLPPFTSNYEPAGKRISIKVEGREDMEIYLAGPSSSATKALVAIYGISTISSQVPHSPICSKLTKSYELSK
jgi:hypothetical protein